MGVIVRGASKRLLWAMGFFAALCGAMVATHNDAWLTVLALSLVFVALPAVVLCWIDWGRAVRNAPTSSRARFALGIILGVPQALLGLLSVLAGLSIVGWVLYNNFIERLPQYTGGFLTFGVGPLLTTVGLAWLRDAFGRHGLSSRISPNDALQRAAAPNGHPDTTGSGPHG